MPAKRNVPDQSSSPHFQIAVDSDGVDVVGDYVDAEHWWRSADRTKPAPVDHVIEAREYLRCIDAYVAALDAAGQDIPYRLNDVAESVRSMYEERPILRVA
jgi:hypothetical protein